MGDGSRSALSVMAFVAANSHMLARELWPGAVGKLQQDKTLTLQNLCASRVVPRDPDELLDWMYVQLVDRGRRAYVFLHPSVDGAKGSPELVIRLQGIIEEVNMGLYGDWDQTEVNAKKAMQKLVLGGARCKEAFAPQLKALGDIREAVSMMAGVCPKRISGASAIVLRRRVFTKASILQLIGSGQVNVDTPLSVVREEEDPSGVLEPIADKWRITSRVKCGHEKEGGQIEGSRGLSLRPGDMVDVSVSVVAVIADTPMGKRCDVIFEPKTVVRLACSEAVEDAFKEATREAATARRRSTSSRAAMEEGFAFEDKRRKVTKPKEKETAEKEMIVASGKAAASDAMEMEDVWETSTETRAEEGGQASGRQSGGGQPSVGQANAGKAPGAQANVGQAHGAEGHGGQASGGQTTGGQPKRAGRRST